jgi:formylglycine-generating enzyme required for sulfatase activity
VWNFTTGSDAPLNIGEVVFVEGGTFQMGSTGGDAGERPVHTVTLNSFYIDTYEVTVAQYRLFCDSTFREMPPTPAWGWNDEDPMVNVSWFDATQYAEWAGKRLPTEAEWEYAARGGILGHGYIYSGDSTLGDVGWYSENSGGLPHHIGTKSANELGLYDMSGNVWEWCSDWYGSYTAEAATNPKGPLNGTYRIMRGGSYAHLVFYCRTTYRYTNNPFSTGFESGGFRCVRDY